MLTVELENLGRLPLRRFTRTEYDRLVELGLFRDEKLELLHGVLVPMSPQGVSHAHVIEELTRLLTLALANRARIRTRLPFAAVDDSEPEPDVAVVPLDAERKSHPSRAHLIVEVAETSQQRDRHVKAPLYAASGVPEYWLVLPESGLVEVYRDPKEGRYQRMESFAKGSSLSLAAFPDVVLAPSGFLP